MTDLQQKADTTSTAIGILAVLIMIAVVLCCNHSSYRAGFKHGEKAMQEKAVLEGHAEYVSAEDGSPSWQWKK